MSVDCVHQVIADSFWSEELCGLLLSCTVDPASIGFDMSDVEIIEKLPQEVWSDFVIPLFMVALCNRADHIYFHAVSSSSFFFLLFLFPRLISAVGDWMSTILPHMVWS